MKILAFFILSSCGQQTETKILPPNTTQACDRAVVCGALSEEQKDPCVRCLEHVSEESLARVEEELGYKIPPLHSVSCEVITLVVHEYTNIITCVKGDWFK